MTLNKPQPTPPIRRLPSLPRTLALVAVCFPLWLFINILYGAVPAIADSGWLKDPTLILIFAIVPSVVQWYISAEHGNIAALFKRSPVFRLGSALLIFVWDIAFPAHGLMISADKANPWLWETFLVAVAIQMAGSWYSQQAWTGAMEDLWRHFTLWRNRPRVKPSPPRSESRPAAPTPLPPTHKAERTPATPTRPTQADIEFSPAE